MVRVRKLVLAIAAASALTSGMAHALGLGEVTMQSALNQPLVAEIELLELRGLGADELIPALASPEAFNRAGVDRQYFLTDLKFTPVIKPNGKSVIRVTSSKPVREPYLNFLVELHWPNGRLLREYTLLLDPPLYNPQPVVSAPVRPAASAPVSTPVRSTVSSPKAAAAPARVTAPVAAAPSAPAPAPTPLGGEYRTTSADTLWDIAQRVPGGSVTQAMLAIQDLNPDAFIGGNINRMKTGQVLRLPDEQQVRSRSQAEASAQVAEQNTAWRERRNVAATSRQLDATHRSSAGAAPAQADASDNLRLVAADSGKATSGSDNGAGTASKGLDDQLAIAQESLETTRRENVELKDRMGDLESRLEKLQRLMQLKNDQLAKLQAELGEGAQQSASEVATDAAAPVSAPDAATQESAPAPTGTVAESAPQEAVAPTLDAAAPGLDAPSSDPLPAGDATAPALVAAPDNAAPGVDASAETQAEGATPAAAEPITEPVAPAEVAPVPQPAEPAAKPVAPAPSGSFLDDLLGDSTLVSVLGGGALLLLLIALLMLSRRNAKREAELHEGLAAAQPMTDRAASETSFDGLDSDATDAELAEAAAQSGDVLDEADIYIAYGRFNQAAELLQGAISEEPERNDLRLKLMEVYAELGDRDGFSREENELREMGGSHPEIEKLKSRYPAMLGAAGAAVATVAATESLNDDFGLDDLDLDDTHPTAVSELDNAFDLSFAELEADLDASTNELAAESGAEQDLNLDFDAQPAAVSLAETDPLADFDLDFDTPAATTSESDQAFLAALEEAPADAFELPADFDLSLPESEAVPPANSSTDFLAELAAADAELNAFSSDLELDVPEALVTEQVPVADGDDDFDFLSGTDETATKLDLARAYIDMGDSEGARDILDEVLGEGSDAQQNEARELLARLV